jgi:hypothetical protein
MPAPVMRLCCQRESKVCISVSLENDQSHQPKKRAGRVTIRMPTSLHDELVAAAEADGVSLNQFVCALLASGMRWRQSTDASGEGGKDGFASGGNLVSDEEYDRIWRKTFR